MMSSGDTRRGVPPGGVPDGVLGRPPPGGGAELDVGVEPDRGVRSAAASDSLSERGPAAPSSEAPPGVGVRTVGLSSAMSPTV
jgi:hypothetical protein